MVREFSKTLVVIAGPTGVGKTAAAIELAQQLRAEIVSADSRQIYKEMTIGTAKPSREELLIVRHHFIDSHSVMEEYDAATFSEDALKVIEALFQKDDYVILCGGSGLYIRAVCEGFDEIPPIPAGIREELTFMYTEHGLEWLQTKMREMDPLRWETIDRQNPQRLMRALEVKMGTGLSITTFQKNNRRRHSFNIVKIGLELEREQLYKRIDMRMDKMIGLGLFEEAMQLYPFRHFHALQTVGYQEIFDYMDGKYDKDEAIRLMKRNSRRYAKRQLTWFRRDAEIKWFHPADVPGIYNFATLHQK
jgi:tRNA dimethylallyltransferase